MRGMNYIFAFMSAAICIVGFTSVNSCNETDIKTVKELLNRRTYIMQNTILGKISYDEGKNQLSQIENDKLYRDDLIGIRTFKEADYDEVTDMKVISLKKRQQVADLIAFEAEIMWTYADNNLIYRQKNEYNIGVIENADGMKLVSLELIQ